MVRITTWNVNGIRNPFGYKPWSETRTFNAMFDILEADIVIMQELKIQRKDLTDDMVLVPGWDCYFSLPKHKKGYSGVGIYTRQSVCAPIRAEEGILGVLCPPNATTPYRDLPIEESIGGYPTGSQISDLGVDPALLDSEGRCVVIEFPAFVLFGVYSPANSNGLRDDFRFGFLSALDTRIRNLAKMGKNVILTGDLNVSRDLIDTAKAEDAMLSEGLTHDEYLNAPNRRIFNQLLLNGEVPGHRDKGREAPVLYDLCREFHPTREGMFTHWEQKINARPANYGSRIDFILCSITIKDWFREADIQEGLMGSDHCPVFAATKDKVPSDRSLHQGSKYMGSNEQHILDLMNPPGMFDNGVRFREYSSPKDIPPYSGKLLPEFTRRRNIRDMFNSKLEPAKTTSMQTVAVTETAHGAEGPDAPRLASLRSAMDKGTTLLGKISPTRTSSAANGHMRQVQSPLNSPEKRRAPSGILARPYKRSKSGLGINGTNVVARGKGQQSLTGFFQPHGKVAGIGAATAPAPPDPPTSSRSEAGDILTGTIAADGAPTSPSGRKFTDPLASQEASKEEWTKLFSRRPAPRCEGHAEPCISLTTKKPGANCGRQFWLCQRPIGPSGQKENGTQWRCGTFIWASDWKK